MARLGAATLVWRQIAADRAVVLTAAAVVLVVTALLAAWPRAVDDVFTQELREQVERSPHFVRDLSGQMPVPGLATAGGGEPAADELFVRTDDALDEILAGTPDLVRPLLGGPEYQFTAGDQELVDHVPETLRAVYLALVVDPHYADRVRVVDGELPSDVAVVSESGSQQAADAPSRIIDVALAVDTAERLDWPVGQVRQLGLSRDGHAADLARLTGIVEPGDPDTAYWSQSQGLLRPREEYDPGVGTFAYARAFVSPAAIAELSRAEWTATVWYPVDGSGLQISSAPDVLDQIHAFTARVHPVEPLGLGGLHPPPALRLRSGVVDQLEDTLTREDSAKALWAVVATGPLGVALAALALCARLIIERRRQAVRLLAARGASGLQLRTAQFVEGVMLGVPATVAGMAAAAWLVPGRAGVIGVALPLIVGLAPALLLPLLVTTSAARVRTDLTFRRSRFRWAVELLVVGLGGASVVVLTRRGLAPAAPQGGVDMLLVATPLLLSLAVCVVVLRVYPVLVAGLGRLLRRRAGVVAFIGTVRAVRDPAAGLAPVLALVVGLSVAVFSTVLWSTVRAGGVATSIDDVGADLRVQGTVVSDEVVTEIERLTGVTAAVSVTEQAYEEVRVGNRVDRAEIFVTDTATLARVQAGLPGVAGIADGLGRLRAGAVPVMVSEELGIPGDDGEVGIGAGLPITVAAATRHVAGLPTSRPWVLVDREAYAAAGVWYERPSRFVLVGAEGDLEIDKGRVAAIVGPQASLVTVDDALTELRAGAAEAGLAAAIVVALAVTGALAAVAVVVSQLVSAPSRGRLFSQLRTLGASGRQAQAIAAWENFPTTMVALLAGASLGVGIPGLVFAALDLRPLTGGSDQPPVTVDWAPVSAVAGMFVAVVALTVAAAAAFSRRLELGSVLRVGEEP